MSRIDRLAWLLLGLVALAGSLAAACQAGAAPTPAGVSPAGDAAPAKAILPAPQWVGGMDVHGKAQLIWIRSAAFATVRVFRREDAQNATFRPLGETRENVWLDETVQPGKSYSYRLTGIGPDGLAGRPSAELTVRIGAVALRPPAPPDWEGYLVVADGVQLKWSAREGEDVVVWNIYRNAPPETEFRLVGSSRGTSYHDVGLEPDRQYIYTLTALDSSFRETPFSKQLPVKFTRTQPVSEPQQRVPAWRVRRTRLVSIIGGAADFPFERPVDVAVTPVSGKVYVTDSARNLVFVFSPLGAPLGILGLNPGGGSAFKNLLGLGIDRDESLYVVDAGAGMVQIISPEGHLTRRVDLPWRVDVVTGLIDAAVGTDGRVYVVDNYNNQISIVGRGRPSSFGLAGAAGGEFSAPTFCAVDAAGNFYVSDCLNARVQVFTGSGEFVRAFGRAERGPGGFGRPKGIAVSAAGEVYVADSWFNTVQVFDAEGRFVAVLGDEAGRPLDLGSPNGVALGPDNRVYIAERLAARLQVREILNVP